MSCEVLVISAVRTKREGSAVATAGRKEETTASEWPERKSEHWKICWEFQSNKGCRKGKYCKWVHPSTGNRPLSRKHQLNHPVLPLQYEIEYGAAYAQHQEPDNWEPTPQPKMAVIEVVAKRLTLDAKAKELAPDAKDLYYISPSKTCCKYQIKKGEF